MAFLLLLLFLFSCCLLLEEQFVSLFHRNYTAMWNQIASHVKAMDDDPQVKSLFHMNVLGTLSPKWKAHAANHAPDQQARGRTG